MLASRLTLFAKATYNDYDSLNLIGIHYNLIHLPGAIAYCTYKL